jgi:hypothetical protein
MKEALNLEQLKSLLAFSHEKEFLTFSKFDLQIPKGAITLVSGFGKTEFVLDFLSEHRDFFTIWIEEKFSFSPSAALQKELSLKNFLFVESGRQTIYTCLQALKSQVFQVVLVYCENIDLKDLRRIQIFSEKSDCITFWLTNNRKKMWPIALQVETENLENLSAHLVQKRF